MKLIDRIQRLLFGSKLMSERNAGFKGADFVVDFYPITRRYYPKYRGRYLDINRWNGLVETLPPYLNNFALWERSESAAWAVIDRFKEDYLKQGVKVLTRPE